MKNEQSRQDMENGHQNELPKKGQNPNDPPNKHTQQGQYNRSLQRRYAQSQRVAIGHVGKPGTELPYQPKTFGVRLEFKFACYILQKFMHCEFGLIQNNIV